MRLVHIVSLTAVTGVTVATPRPHVHHRAHGVAQRAPQPDKVVYAPATIETVVKYVLDGHDISVEDVRSGLANGTLEWGADGNLSYSAEVPATIATSTPAPAPPSPTAQPEQKAPPESKPKPDDKPKEPQPAPEPAPKPSNPDQPSQVDKLPHTADQLVDSNGHCASCDKEFPNSKIPCSQFPYGYGALPIGQEGLGGWSGIQDPQYRGGDGFDDITTTVSGSCNDGSCCKPGCYCSYGCPNPYLKLSFPKKQGRTGQTVGGLYCNDQGMLEMADGAIGKTMCGPGSSSMTVKVQNKLKKSVSICRTDYPGKLNTLYTFFIH